MGHSATLLANGRLLVAGGEDQQAAWSSIHASAELYEPVSATWAPAANMTTPRGGHSATRLITGHVLVVGGYTEEETLATAELATPDGGAWSPAASMAGPRWAHSATRLANGHVLIAGGYDDTGTALDSAEIYDPAGDSWSAVSTMTIPRTFHVAVELSSTQILVAGGVKDSYPLPTGFTAVHEAEIYDAPSGSWSHTASMSDARFAHTLTRQKAGTVVAAGGMAGDASVLQTSEIYDPASSSWFHGPQLTTPRRTHTANLLADGSVLVSGGHLLHQPLHTAERLAP
jgi:hypothetical protein